MYLEFNLAGRLYKKLVSKHVNPIPRHVWTYWNGPLPSEIGRISNAWSRILPDYEITFLNSSNYVHYVKSRPAFDFTGTRDQHQADWVRLAVLMENGGFWLDATMVLTDSLDFILEKQSKLLFESFCYHLDIWTRNEEFPMIENWLIASIPRGQFITAWFLEFDHAINVGPKYIDEIRTAFGDETFKVIVQGCCTNDDYNYFKMHLAASKLATIYNITTYSESSLKDPHFFHELCGWDGDCVVSKLFSSYNGYIPRMIKLSSTHSSRIEEYLLAPVQPTSIFFKYIM